MQTDEKKENPKSEFKLFHIKGPVQLNNNHHVVPLGIIVVLCTVYVTIVCVQNNYSYYFQPGVDAVQVSVKEEIAHLLVLHKEGTEEQTLCRQIDVFTKGTLNEKGANQSVKQSISPKRRRQLKTHKVNGRLTKSEAQKKKDNAKKTNTAEPIIYLFALVFIYLLLKAASDINQHYKTQNKGDKRLRRCSLQSYAQKEQRHNHQDRRASKDIPLQTRHNIFVEGRSVSLDRYRPREVSREPLRHFRQQSSIAEPPKMYPFKPVHPAVGKHLVGEGNMEPRMSRRLSVPVSINYQMVQVSPLVTPDLARRGSVTDMASLAAPNVQSPDSKRRVRMINRH